MADPFAKDPDGRPLYVVTHGSIWHKGNDPEHLHAADDLADAKRQHGYTRALHEWRKVRRARESDVARLAPERL